MSDRDQFEAWAKRTGACSKGIGFNKCLTPGSDVYDDPILQGYWYAWQASREALKAEQEGAWIACSERMPNPKTGVMVGCWFGQDWAVKWATYLPYRPDAHKSGFLMPGASWNP